MCDSDEIIHCIIRHAGVPGETIDRYTTRMSGDGLSFVIDEHTAAAYLRASGRIGRCEPVKVERLAGGVSNEVLFVTPQDRPGEEFVLKQVRGQLRTPEPWFSSLERIWREVAVMRVCQDVLDRAAAPQLTARTPRLLFEDRPHHAVAMSAAPREHHVWKQDLLEGRADAEVARQCGRLLGRLHAGTWLDATLANELGDRTLFDELRLDPYYRSLAKARPECAKHVDALLVSTEAYVRSLVHADFTPKNLLVWPGGLMMVDFETGHFGDPAFDLGLFLAHLVLKAIYRRDSVDNYLALPDAFWREYEAIVRSVAGDMEYDELVARGLQHLAGCTWARLDGKSRVDYITDEATRDEIRRACLQIFETRPDRWDAAVAFFPFSRDAERALAPCRG